MNPPIPAQVICFAAKSGIARTTPQFATQDRHIYVSSTTGQLRGQVGGEAVRLGARWAAAPACRPAQPARRGHALGPGRLKLLTAEGPTGSCPRPAAGA